MQLTDAHGPPWMRRASSAACSFPRAFDRVEGRVRCQDNAGARIFRDQRLSLKRLSRPAATTRFQAGGPQVDDPRAVLITKRFAYQRQYLPEGCGASRRQRAVQAQEPAVAQVLQAMVSFDAEPCRSPRADSRIRRERARRAAGGADAAGPMMPSAAAKSRRVP